MKNLSISLITCFIEKSFLRQSLKVYTIYKNIFLYGSVANKCTALMAFRMSDIPFMLTRYMLKDCNFIKKFTLAKLFPVNFVKFFRTPFYRKPVWDWGRERDFWRNLLHDFFPFGLVSILNFI